MEKARERIPLSSLQMEGSSAATLILAHLRLLASRL